MNQKQWLRGLIKVAISSGSTAILAFIGVPAVGLTINFKLFAVFVAADVIVSLATFLKANPLPDDSPPPPTVTLTNIPIKTDLAEK
jgi:hypothetical protein